MTVTSCGRICFNGRKVNLSHALAGQNVGVTQVGDRIRLESVTYVSGINRHPCDRNRPSEF
jgi:putative transposase